MIRIENTKICKFVAELLYNLAKGLRPRTVDSDYYSGFKAWKIGGLFVTESYDREAGHAINAYTDKDFFYVSYYAAGECGLLTLGKSRSLDAVDDPRY